MQSAGGTWHPSVLNVMVPIVTVRLQKFNMNTVNDRKVHQIKMGVMYKDCEVW